MKLGFCGGLANNMLVFAKAARACGLDARLLQDHSDFFVMSQPLWDEFGLVIDPNDSLARFSKDATALLDYQTKVGWKKSDWMIDPKNKPVPGITLQGEFGLVDKIAIQILLGSRPIMGKTASAMQENDFNLVCGIWPAICAMASGRPYGIWPHGRDIRVAAGIEAMGGDLASKAKGLIIKHCLRLAFHKAAFVGTHDPSGLGMHAGEVTEFSQKIIYLPIPAECQKPASRSEKLALREQLKSHGIVIPLDIPVAFVPSRLDVFWKGHDRLLQALQNYPLTNNPICVLFSSWGADQQRLLSNFKPPSSVHLARLPGIVSRPLLHKITRASELVFDQFVAGIYGTNMIEAMAQGTPVSMHINSDLFNKRGWPPPPVFQAQTPGEIMDVLSMVARGEDLTPRISEQQNWLIQRHGMKTAIDLLLEAIKI